MDELEKGIGLGIFVSICTILCLLGLVHSILWLINLI